MNFNSLLTAVLALLLLKFQRIYSEGIFTRRINGTIFYIELDQKFNWFDSQIACSQVNMNLVEINTREKFEQLKPVTESDVKNGAFWTGGIRREVPLQKFVWFSTGQEFTYTNWYAQNPDFRDNIEYCVELLAAFSWRWNDNDCYTKKGFICEESQKEKQYKENLKQLKHIEAQKLEEKQEVEKHLEEEIKQKNNIQKQLTIQQEMLQQLNNTHKDLQENLEVTTKKNQNLQTELEKFQKLKQQHEILEKLFKVVNETKNNLVKELKTQKDMQQKDREQIQDLIDKQKEPENSFNESEKKARIFENDLEILKKLAEKKNVQTINYVQEQLQQNNGMDSKTAKDESKNFVIYSPYSFFLNTF